MTTLQVYYWVSFAVTFLACMAVPSKTLSRADNFMASVIVAMFGFILWPIALAACYAIARGRA